ncbi:hypothetical protein GL218_03641 [Daldinia childiae]|uniref:uncharacterized protein n=1 Tax=Daldinia childiae TaxID=326645 RepID=UPI001447FF96|nr:uncharacterized protein GL218_03641 [Daldinia childiae]KAF3062289.1 hypothetical protein GL218_03641 [Daldinia childiae]
MLFPESDASLLRAWIIRRLANTSDADADVLADYVLALLRHDGDVESIRKMFEEEIPDFLREDAAAFTGDVFQAVKYRSYLPGAPPAPPSGRQALAPPPVAPLIPSYQPQVPYNTTSTAPAFPQNGSRKRAYNDRDDNDVDIILTSQGSYSGAQPYKQPRRGGGFSQRGGRFDESYKPRDQNGFSGPYPASSRSNGRFGLPPPPSFQPSTHDHGIPPINLDNLMENIQRMNQLDIPIPQLPDLPKPVYSGSIPPPRRRRQKCRDYETRGYCSRGSNCKFEHGSDSLMMPPLPPSANDEYDPNNAVFPMPLLANPHQPQAFQPLNLPPFSTAAPTNRREHNKSRRTKGRPPNTTSGPIHDKTKTAIVVQNIPSGYFTEEKVREYFSQFGNIADISIQGPDRLAVVKFDTWDAAHAAWSSPKVIFDNRFVKVFWHKDDTESRPNSVNGKAGNGAKNGATNGNSLIEESAPTESFDMDEFIRKQEEAQKAHEEKTKKREELERQRQELEERQKELRARQLEEKRRLQAKLTGKSSSETTDDTTKKPTSQTEALKAQLAALEEEANVLGIDPDAIHEDSSWSTRGRGRGGRGYRGRGRYVARATRGGHSYQGRGGIEARHAAYAAYSLDNRPKIIALSGVDFTNLEKDEALRQYLFGIGEFKEIHTDPAATHITFKDRKTAEQFMMGVSANNAIPGLEDKVEITWATSAPQSETKTHADDNVPMANGIEDDQGARDKTSAEGSSSVTIGLEEGEVSNGHGRDQHDMDYEAGEDWDIS